MADVREELGVGKVAVLVLEVGKFDEGWEVGGCLGGGGDVEFNVVVFVGGGSFGLSCRGSKGSGWLRHGGGRGEVELGCGRLVGWWPGRGLKGSKMESRSSRRSWVVGRLGNGVETPVLNSMPASAKLRRPSARSTRNCLQAPGPLLMLRYLVVGKAVMGWRLERCMIGMAIGEWDWNV